MRNTGYAVIAFCLIWVALIFRYTYLINSSDLFQYLSIAGKYVRGEFPLAFNSFYSPLLSWLFVPFLAAGVHYWWAYVIIQFVCGLFILFQLRDLLVRLAIPQIWLSVLAPLPAVFGLFYQAPDLLFLLFFLIIVNLVLQDKIGWVRLGIAAIFLYLSKSIGYLYFTAFVFVIILWNFFFHRKAVLSYRNLYLALAFMWLFVGVWWLLISWNEGHFTTGTTAAYNRIIFHPNNTPKDFPFAIFHHPFNQDGLFEPPNATAVNAWEQPMQYKFASWKISEHPIHFIKIIFHNVYNLAWINEWSLGVLGLLISLFFMPLCVLRALRNRHYFILIAAGIILTAGYCLILVQGRYLWGASIALWLALLYGLYHFPFRYYQKLVIMILAFMAPVYAFSELIIDEWAQRKDIRPALAVSPDIPSGSRVANMEWERNRAYELTTAFCYEKNLKHYGNVPEAWTWQQQKQELKKFEIDYYITWRPGDTTTFGGELIASQRYGFRLIKLK